MMPLEGDYSRNVVWMLLLMVNDNPCKLVNLHHAGSDRVVSPQERVTPLVRRSTRQCHHSSGVLKFPRRPQCPKHNVLRGPGYEHKHHIAAAWKGCVLPG
jgi:hypothetical protein